MNFPLQFVQIHLAILLIFLLFSQGFLIENRLIVQVLCPDMIIKLLNQNADFQEIYEEVYTICLNMERMMEMFSKELAILDRNTVKLMIDEMEEEVVEAKRKADEAESRAK
jgi:hypothetical protein